MLGAQGFCRPGFGVSLEPSGDGRRTMPAWALLSPIAGTLKLSPLIDHLPSTFLALSPRFPIHITSAPLSSRSGLSLRRSQLPEARVRFSAGEHGRNPSQAAGGPAAEEAREAVVEVLREYGASEEDCIEITSNSPKYIEMLVENVRELDEHSLWSSWDNEEETELGGLSFKKKVSYMAERKGDLGILPLLESVGLKHSSAMLIARCLSSKRLPDLIDKETLGLCHRRRFSDLNFKKFGCYDSMQSGNNLDSHPKRVQELYT